jgi:5-methylcytosine-specific restriction endonuclease McrA
MTEKQQEREKMMGFFLSIWKKRKHRCTNCDKWLGNEPLSYMFDHLLEKSKYPHLKYEEDNICIVCLECHDNKTRGFPGEKIKNLIKTVREKFGI